jgi:Mg2+ and Co2+ transporter CorA
MLKIIYNEKPYYSNGGEYNDPTTKDLTITFDDEASTPEILGQVIRLLQFMTYPVNSKKQLYDIIDRIVDSNSLIVDDLEEENQELN